MHPSVKNAVKYVNIGMMNYVSNVEHKNLQKKMFGGYPQPLLSEEQVKKIREEIQSDDSKIPIVCLPPITKEDIIWAIRHPNRKRKASNVIELRQELTAEEEEMLIKLIEYHKETLKLLAE